MEPFTLMAIGLGLGAAGKMAGGAMDAAALHTAADKERLEELERLQDLNQLGLTEEESARMSEAMVDPLQAMQRQRSIERREMAAGADLGAGAVARQMLLGEESEQRAMADVDKELSRADTQRSSEQKAEIQALKKGADLRKNQMLKAIITGAAEGGSQIIGAKGQTMALQEMTGQGQMSTQQQQMMRQNMIQQQYMNQLYGQQVQPYQQYYNQYYGQQYQMPPYFGPTTATPYGTED
mgnify:CR=1 FL=1